MSNSSSSSSSSSSQAPSIRRSSTRATAGQRSTGDDYYYSVVSSDDEEIQTTTLPSKMPLDLNDDEFPDPDVSQQHVPVVAVPNSQAPQTFQRSRKRKRNSSSQSSSDPVAKSMRWTKDRSNVNIPVGKWRQGKDVLTVCDSDPFTLFSFFVTDDVLKKWVIFTNEILKKRHPKAASTTVPELRAFIGAHLCMSLWRASTISEYWGSEVDYQSLKNHFSRDRFKVLNACFSISEPANFNEESTNPVSYCVDFIKHLNETFPAYWKRHQNVAFDESVVAFTGHSSIRQYIPMKPHQFGYKIWGLSDAGYYIRFSVYEGADSVTVQHSKTHDLILEFVKDLENKNHILYIDNFFTSPALANALASKGIAVCGAVRMNRKNLPDPAFLNEEILKEMKRGDTMYFRNDNMNLLCWKDQQVLKLLFNHRNINEAPVTIQRYFESGAWKDVQVHPAINDYFKHARAIDIVNQYHYNYVIGRKSRHFSTSLMWWCIDMCIVNAFHLHKQNDGNLTHLNFRKSLMHSLFKQHTLIRTPPLTTRAPKCTIYDALIHYSDRRDSEKDCAHCSGRDGKRHRTHYVCVGCNIHLCIGSCFFAYHHQLRPTINL
jgi:hypothetical protein